MIIRLIMIFLGFFHGTISLAGDEIHHTSENSLFEGTIRIWGSEHFSQQMLAWEKGFKAKHPMVTFSTKLRSSSAAIAGLYTGEADIGLMDTPIKKDEILGFEWVFRYLPLGVQVASGSYADSPEVFSPAVITHHDNPIRKLSLSQVDAIFGAEKRRGYSTTIKFWGQLNAGGKWKEGVIQPYSYPIATSIAQFIQRKVLLDSSKWNCSLIEIDSIYQGEYRFIDISKKIVEHVAADPFAVAIVNANFITSKVKIVALADKPSEGSYTMISDNSIISNDYPLTRPMRLFVNRSPDGEGNPLVNEFVRYILSVEGQSSVIKGSSLLPLSGNIAKREYKKFTCGLNPDCWVADSSVMKGKSGKYR